MAMHRQTRVEHLLSQLLGSMIVSGEIKDPRVSTLVSIGDISVAKDLSHAKIGVSGYMDDKELELAVEGLNSAAGFIQSRLAKSLQTRLTPRLHFEVNRNIKAAFEMSKTLDSLNIKHETSDDNGGDSDT